MYICMFINMCVYVCRWMNQPKDQTIAKRKTIDEVLSADCHVAQSNLRRAHRAPHLTTKRRKSNKFQNKKIIYHYTNTTINNQVQYKYALPIYHTTAQKT